MKKMGGISIILTMALMLASCTTNYLKTATVSVLESAYLVDSHQVERRQRFTLHRASKVYLQTTKYSSETSPNSAKAPSIMPRQVALELGLLKNLRAIFPLTIQGEPSLSLQSALVDAAELKADFLVHSYIAYNDTLRNSAEEMAAKQGSPQANSYTPEHSTVILVVFDVLSQSMLDTIRIHSNERWFAGEKHQQNYLQAATAAALVKLSPLQ